jgi:leucyl-tRNA synthetase
MELLNLCTSSQETLNSAARAFVADLERNIVLLLHPFAPYLSYELWEKIGESSDLLREPWPQFDPELAKEEEIEMAVQINGKLRARILVPAEAEEDEIKKTAMADDKVQAAVAGKQIVKTIVIKGKLVNIVVK